MIPIRLPSPGPGSSEKEWADWARAVNEAVNRFRFAALTWDPAAVPALSTLDTEIDAPGVKAGMAVAVSPPAALAPGLGVCAWSATDDHITVRLANVGLAPIDPASGTWTYLAVKAT